MEKKTFSREIEFAKKLLFKIEYKTSDGKSKTLTTVMAYTPNNVETAFIDWFKKQSSNLKKCFGKIELFIVSPAGKKIKRLDISDSINEEIVQYPQQTADFAPVKQKPVSLDQLVDRYIVRYERESIPLEGEQDIEDIRNPNPPNQNLEEGKIDNLISFLLEQDMPVEETPLPEEPAMDTTSNTQSANASPPVVNTPKINMNNFTRSIARLLNNFNALLNPKTIILNRAESYIANNYDERTAKQFVQIMERNYGVSAVSNEYPDDRNDYPEPYAAGALLGAGGSGGG